MCSKSLIILKTHIVKAMGCYLLPVRLAKLESLIKPGVGKHEGYGSPHALLMGL